MPAIKTFIMIPYSVSKSMLLVVILICWFSHLSIVVQAEDPRAKKIQEEYWKNNPTFPDAPLDTPEPISKEAYAYMYCTRPEIDSSTTYYDALRLLVYKLKHINENYDPNPKDIIILVCSYTEQSQIDVIKSLGVIVLLVDPIIPTGQLAEMPSYIDQYTKLHLWRLIKWERILYMDLDTTMTKDFLTVWDEPAAQIKTKPKSSKDAEYYPYLFAAVEDLVPRRRKCNDCYFNGGVFMLKPDLAYFKRLIDGMNKYDSNRGFMEQDYFNHVYRKSGPIPAARLPPSYNRFVIFSEENVPGTKIMHNKMWAQSKYVKNYFEAWWDDFNHLFRNSPIGIERVYELDDVFLMNSTNKEAYVFSLNINDVKAKDNFMMFPALKMNIIKIKEYDTRRDIIVLSIDDVPSWQLKELIDLGAWVIRVKHEEKSKASWSDDYIRIMLWKLINWDRLLYIDNDVFITNKDFINIWNEDSNKIHTQPKQDSKKPLHNVPTEYVHRFYPYIFSATSDSSEGHFYPNMFMFKPSIAHHDYLMSHFNINNKKQDLLNFAYSQDGSIPASNLDQSYNSASLNKYTKALNGKIWTRLHEKENNPYVTKFWDSFDQFVVGTDGKKIFDKFDLPSNCKEGTSPTRCDVCEAEYDFIDNSKAPYMICPQSVPFGKTLDWLEFDDQCKSISKECISCIQDGKCSSCETGFLPNHHCVISPKVSHDIIGYCSSSSDGSFSYIAKGSICASRLTQAKIAKRVLICVVFLFIMAITLLFSRFILRKLLKRFRKTYAKMQEDNSTDDLEEVGTSSTSNQFKGDNNA